jgi:hypothetical protein
MTSDNSGYEALAFGFRPNPRYAWTPHIREPLGEIAMINIRRCSHES